MKVDLKWLLIIGVCFSFLLVGQYWAGAQWRSLQGPDLLTQDQQGNVYVGVHSKILRYTPEGTFLDERDLLALGVAQRIGGIAFFANGDFLMVPQHYQPSLLQNLLTHYRITTEVPVALKGASGRLSRCAWETLVCTPLVHFERQFSEAFWVDVDSRNNIFVADVSRHQVLWLDEHGREIDHLGPMPGLKFPNQVQRRDDSLWIANCNDNSLSQVRLGELAFEKTLTRYPLRSSMLPSSDRWPIGFAFLSSGFSVLAKGDNLSHGSLVRMNAAGEVTNLYSLPAASHEIDYIALSAVGNEIWAADYANLTVHRFSEFGDYLGEFADERWLSVVVPLRAAMAKYQRLERYFSWIFWSLLVLGFALAFWLERRHQARQTLPPVTMVADRQPPASNDSRIRWLRYGFYWRRLHSWLIWFWAPLLVLMLPLLFSTVEESARRASFFLCFHGLLLLQLIRSSRLTRCRLGALSPWVYVMSGKHVTCVHEKDLRVYAVMGSVVLMMGNQDLLVKQRNRSLFEGEMAREYIERLLSMAQPMAWGERLQWVLEHKLASLVWQVLLTLLYLLAIAVNMFT